MKEPLRTGRDGRGVLDRQESGIQGIDMAPRGLRPSVVHAEGYLDVGQPGRARTDRLPRNRRGPSRQARHFRARRTRSSPGRRSSELPARNPPGGRHLKRPLFKQSLESFSAQADGETPIALPIKVVMLPSGRLWPWSAYLSLFFAATAQAQHDAWIRPLKPLAKVG